MNENKFISVAANFSSEKWQNLISRQEPLYQRENDIRTEFYRDYTRILHSLAYRRLKHKTQVFFNTQNDHICTRIEHVNHVESVSYTISKYLGLNTELTSAIAIGHDVGHAPFGHEGEKAINNIYESDLNEKFWHEKHGLFIVDHIELLEDDRRKLKNLNLSYAVRDGIISHCGEVDENALYPRDEFIDLKDFDAKSKYKPYTWEACIVKISDKIAYLGRDIEDALRLNFIGEDELYALKSIARKCSIQNLNTTQIMHQLILSLCQKSSPDSGIVLEERFAILMNEIKKFNTDRIYNNPKFKSYKKFVCLIITTLFDHFDSYYCGHDTVSHFANKCSLSGRIKDTFIEWLALYTNDKSAKGLQNSGYKMQRHNNVCVYDLSNRINYDKCVIDYVAGMSDHFAYMIFEEITRF